MRIVYSNFEHTEPNQRVQKGGLGEGSAEGANREDRICLTEQSTEALVPVEGLEVTGWANRTRCSCHCPPPAPLYPVGQ